MAESAKSKPKLVDSDEEGDPGANVTICKQNENEENQMEDDPEGDLGKNVDIDFSLFDYVENDFHALRRQLTSFPDILLPMHMVADIIVNQVEVGATLRAFEKTVGFCTILNCTLNKEEKWFKTLSNFLKKRDARWETLLKTKLGLLMHFRMINLPQSLGTPVQESLRQDLEWVQTDECKHLNAEQKKSWKLDNIAVLCKRRREVVDEPVYDKGEVTEAEIAAGTIPPPNKKRKAVEFEFMYDEDKVYQKYATIDITFGSESICSTPGSDCFHLLILPYAKWIEAVEEISLNQPEGLS